MARLTKTQIFEAIASIQANGERPTSKMLHEYFGSGSYSTFTKYLRKYESENVGDELTGESVTLSIPQPLQLSLSSFANKFWEMAQRNADESVEQEKKQYESLRQQNQQQLDDAVSFADPSSFSMSSPKFLVTKLNV